MYLLLEFCAVCFFVCFFISNGGFSHTIQKYNEQKPVLNGWCCVSDASTVFKSVLAVADTHIHIIQYTVENWCYLIQCTHTNIGVQYTIVNDSMSVCAWCSLSMCVCIFVLFYRFVVLQWSGSPCTWDDIHLIF